MNAIEFHDQTCSEISSPSQDNTMVVSINALTKTVNRFIRTENRHFPNSLSQLTTLTILFSRFSILMHKANILHEFNFLTRFSWSVFHAQSILTLFIIFFLFYSWHLLKQTLLRINSLFFSIIFTKFVSFPTTSSTYPFCRFKLFNFQFFTNNIRNIWFRCEMNALATL